MLPSNLSRYYSAGEKMKQYACWVAKECTVVLLGASRHPTGFGRHSPGPRSLKAVCTLYTALTSFSVLVFSASRRLSTQSCFLSLDYMLEDLNALHPQHKLWKVLQYSLQSPQRLASSISAHLMRSSQREFPAYPSS